MFKLAMMIHLPNLAFRALPAEFQHLANRASSQWANLPLSEEDGSVLSRM